MAGRGAQLSLIALTKRFGDVRAVDELSLDIKSGEFVTLLGPSGSGKTTTLNMVAGFVTPTTGEVFLNGIPVTNQPPYRRGLGVVFQNYALFPHLSVFENVAFPLRVRRRPKPEIRRRVEDALNLVGLDIFADRMPRQLSGGQQQRVALARALVFDPPALLMDEPLGALDKKLRGRLQLEIKQIQARLGITVIYVTHDQEEALAMSDRIAVMNRGRIEQLGTPTELYERPVNQFVADFIGETNFIGGTILEHTEDVSTVQLVDSITVRAQGEWAWETGDRVLLAIRPEDICLTQEPARATNCLRGQIEEVLFLGESTKYVVRLTASLCINVRLQRSRGQFRQGDWIVLHWEPADARLLMPVPGGGER
jgi:spermidine/putrescine ABC transporter ATP-binding subunit